MNSTAISALLTVGGPDVLGYWRGRDDIRNTLSRCAKWILSTPASSTSSESLFYSWTNSGRPPITAEYRNYLLSAVLAWLARTPRTVDAGRQQCCTGQLTLEIADAIQEHDVDLIDFVCTVPFQSVLFCDTV